MILTILFKPKAPILLLIFITNGFLFAQTTCFITVSQNQVINPNSGKFLGVSFDGRTSAYYASGQSTLPLGYYDPASGIPLAAVKPAWDRIPLKGVRYPGNLITSNWNWSYTVGPVSDRPAQSIAGFLPVQSLVFGFDEFMGMISSKGLPSQEAQIMVNIMPSTGQSDPAILAADWVEYANTPNDGTNPRGGTNWAAVRDSFGHPTPYSIEIWNLGNEPWGPTECCQNNPALFISMANPIIDSMLKVDPTLHITLPSVGNGNSAWNQAILNSSTLAGKFYGLSPHYFYDEDLSTPNPSVAQIETALKNLTSTASNHGVKIIVGDHAHNAPNNDPDKAMRWEGTLATADFLLMVSQISNIELANYWIYGNPNAVWHPIRPNADGTYTFMAAAQLYEMLNEVFIDQSLSSSVADSVGGTVTSVRSSAFRSNDGSKTNIAIVNTNYTTDRKVALPVLPGYSLQSVKLTTANIADDTSQTVQVAPLPDGKYLLPHTSLLVFEFTDNPLAVEFAEPLRAFAVGKTIRVEWATAAEIKNSHFEVERSRDGIHFEKIGQIPAKGNASNTTFYYLTDPKPHNGTNYYRIKAVDLDGKSEYSKIVSSHFEIFVAEIYPNPASNLLFVNLPNHLRVDETGILIFDAFGKIMLETNLTVGSMNEIKIGSWPPGMYCLKFSIDSGLSSQVFVKK